MFFPAEPELDLFVRALLLGPLTLLWVTFLVRVAGLRSFSKMTAFDFVSTVATGSLLANAATASKWSDFLQSCVAISAILGVQCLLARLRRKSATARNWLENEPLLLMRDGEFLRGAMKKSRVAESDVWAKLREANVSDPSEVRAVVLETTGDISVLHGSEPSAQLLRSVRHPDAQPAADHAR